MVAIIMRMGSEHKRRQQTFSRSDFEVFDMHPSKQPQPIISDLYDASLREFSMC